MIESPSRDEKPKNSVGSPFTARIYNHPYFNGKLIEVEWMDL
jgi:hypothetical protein